MAHWPWAKTLAMLGAVIVSVTLIPALSVWMLKGQLKPISENKISLFIVSYYERVLKIVLENKKNFLAIPLVVFLIGIVSLFRLGSEFMPSLNEGELLYIAGDDT